MGLGPPVCRECELIMQYSSTPPHWKCYGCDKEAGEDGSGHLFGLSQDEAKEYERRTTAFFAEPSPARVETKRLEYGFVAECETKLAPPYPAEQPDPKPNASRPVWEMVIEDMKKRDEIGRARYGTPLQVDNGRCSLQDLYEELLDACVYVRQEIEQRKIVHQRLQAAEELLAQIRDVYVTATRTGLIDKFLEGKHG